MNEPARQSQFHVGHHGVACAVLELQLLEPPNVQALGPRRPIVDSGVDGRLPTNEAWFSTKNLTSTRQFHERTSGCAKVRLIRGTLLKASTSFVSHKAFCFLSFLDVFESYAVFYMLVE